MLIIVEGPDGVGKSTLVERLASRLRLRLPTDTVEVLHRGVPTSHALDEYETPLLSYRPGAGRHVICDRWHLGELVYPVIHRRGSTLDDATLWHITAFLRSRGALVVSVDRGDDYVLDTYSERGDPGWQVSELDNVRELFTRAYERSGLPVVGYRSQSVARGGLITDIIQRAYVAGDVNTSALAPFITYVGPRRPRLLLLGDERNNHVSGDVGDLEPSFVPRPSTSGHYLLRALSTLPLQRDTTGVANACDEDDVEKLWEVLYRPRVVTLGRNASRRLDSLKIPHGAAAHPQFVRRFYHSKLSLYATSVADAAYTGEDRSTWPR